tara:strand:- start:6323 stop:6646 length:324 start_codon:yes stop_codon:yes gene_type:complete
MNAFELVIPYIGMGGTSSNVNGNLIPHTIVSVNTSTKEITTTLDSHKRLDMGGEYTYTTNRDGDKIEWVLKDNANPSQEVYIPKFPSKSPYHQLVINKREHYINNNL